MLALRTVTYCTENEETPPCDHAQQPLDVVTRRAQHRVQPVASFTLEVTAFHPVVALEVADDGLDGLAPLEQLSLLFADPLGLAPVHDVHTGQVRVHAPVAQIGVTSFRRP